MSEQIITCTMKLLTGLGPWVEKEGSTCVADNDADSDEARTLKPLQAAACTNRIACGPRAGRKVRYDGEVCLGGGVAAVPPLMSPVVARLVPRKRATRRRVATLP